MGKWKAALLRIDRCQRFIRVFPVVTPLGCAVQPTSVAERYTPKKTLTASRGHIIGPERRLATV